MLYMVRQACWQCAHPEQHIWTYHTGCMLVRSFPHYRPYSMGKHDGLSPISTLRCSPRTITTARLSFCRPFRETSYCCARGTSVRFVTRSSPSSVHCDCGTPRQNCFALARIHKLQVIATMATGYNLCKWGTCLLLWVLGLQWPALISQVGTDSEVAKSSQKSCWRAVS